MGLISRSPTWTLRQRVDGQSDRWSLEGWMEVEGEGWVRDTPAGGHCQLGGVGNHTHHTSKPHTTPDAHHNHLSPLWSRLNSPGKATSLKCWHLSRVECGFQTIPPKVSLRPWLDISECQGIHMSGHLIVVFSSGGIKCPEQKGSLHLTGRNAASMPALAPPPHSTTQSASSRRPEWSVRRRRRQGGFACC